MANTRDKYAMEMVYRIEIRISDEYVHFNTPIQNETNVITMYAI